MADNIAAGSVVADNIITQSIRTLFERGDFFVNLVCEHLALSLISAGVAFVLGLFIAVLIAEFRGAAKLILNAINLIYIIPAISLLGLLIPFFGIGNVAAAIALILYALLPMVRNSYTAITSIDPKIIDTATGMGASRAQIIAKIKLPLALPAIISSLRTMLIMTISLAGIAAFIGAGGLGVAIYRGITTNNQSLIIAGSVLMIALALICDFVLGLVERYTSIDYKIRVRQRGQNSLFWVKKIAILTLFLAVSVLGVMGLWGEKKQLVIASKPMSEQYIISEALKILLEQEGISVRLVQGVGGGTANIDIGMQSGEIDAYVEYTGTAWGAVMREAGVYDEGQFGKIERFYQNRGMRALYQYGFNNTFGIAVKKELANRLNISTFSDLARHSAGLSFGAEYDFFDRDDGYKGLKSAYGFGFKKTFDLDIGLKYDALLGGQVDAINIFTTDARLENDDIVVLRDDLGFYPSYRAINIVREGALLKFPALKGVLKRLEGAISDQQMAKLNARVELQKMDAKSVAREFLGQNGLLREQR